MQIRLENRNSFNVCGYAVETNLSSCGNDVGRLWQKYKDTLLALPESKSCLYGVMWYTENHNYYYLLGIEAKIPPISHMTAVQIPAANFAAASAPGNNDTVEAWTQFFERELPCLGYLPDAQHGLYFEFYNSNGQCELWTPVNKIPK